MGGGWKEEHTLLSGGYTRDDRTEREHYLKEKLNRLRQAEDVRAEQVWRNRDAHRQQLREQAEAERRTAEDWKEALQKQARLFEREARMWPPEECETSFQEGARACKRGLELWQDVEARHQPEIDALLKQLEVIRDAMRFEVADKLEQEGQSDGW